jgi:hypothetical protein
MGPRSKVATLPAGVKAWLEKALMESGFSGYSELEALLTEKGYSIGRSSLHREGQKLQRRLASIKAATDAAREFALAAPDDADNRSMAVMGMIQGDLFEILVSLQEIGEKDAEDRMAILNKASLAISRLSRARVNQSRRADEVNARLAEQARAAAVAGAQAEGLTPEQAARVGAEVAKRIQIYLPDNGR